MYKPKVYTASNLARVKLWHALREEPEWQFVEWTASWIDVPLLDKQEPLDVETCAEGWAQNFNDIRKSDFLLLYGMEYRTPLRGALVEAGMALGLGLRVIAVGCDESQTWSYHPRVVRLPTLGEARSLLYRYTTMIPPNLNRTRKDRHDADD
jgi:hypothetical protein